MLALPARRDFTSTLRGQAGFHALFDEVLVTGGSVEVQWCWTRLCFTVLLLMTGALGNV